MREPKFTVGIAKTVMELWKQHLGFYGGVHRYYTNPQVLVDSCNLCFSRIGFFQDSIGSKYSDDSKLTIKIIGDVIEVDCYAQAHGMLKKDGELAEDKFNTSVAEYLKSINYLPK